MAQFIKYKNAKNEVRYKFKVYLGLDPVTGKRIETSRQGFKTKREAKLALDAIRADFNANGWNNKPEKKLTVNDVFGLWFETYKRTVKTTTAHNHQYTYNRYYRENIGKLHINKINSSYLQKYINNLSNKVYSYQQIVIPLRLVFNFAFKQHIIDDDIFKRIIFPKPNQSIKKKLNTGDDNFYTKDELVDFLTKIEKEDIKMYTLFRLLAFSGLRIGEALALTWDDIQQNSVDVNKTALIDSITKKVVINTPKTKKSIRRIDIDDQTMLILNKWRMQCYSNNLVFPNRNLGYLRQSTVSGLLAIFYKNHPELKQITIHGFRHTHASLLFESGATIKDVQVRLGHSDIKTTMNIYTHVTKDRKKDTVKKFANFMNF